MQIVWLVPLFVTVIIGGILHRPCPPSSQSPSHYFRSLSTGARAVVDYRFRRVKERERSGKRGRERKTKLKEADRTNESREGEREEVF